MLINSYLAKQLRGSHQTKATSPVTITMGRLRQRVDKKREALFMAALKDLETGKEPSIRAAAERYGLKYETLRDRKRGAKNRVEAHEDQQNLTYSEEEAIKEWIAKVDGFGWPPRVEYVREMALGFIRSHGIRNPKLGKNWMTQFLDRHPDLASRFTDRLDKQRAFASNPAILRDSFKKVGFFHSLKIKVYG